MPYPLPGGDLGEDDIVCQLVFLPDKPEYWQAFISALHYFGTWRAWERDSSKRGKDAAGNWREANELTMECWRMACLQDLQDNVAEILAIMQLGNGCCDEQDYTDGNQYTDRVEDGVGNVPQNIIDAGYASGTSDWAGFDDYKCMICHVTVDTLEARLRKLDGLLNEYGAIFGGVAAVAAVLAVAASGGGLLIIVGMLASIGAVSFLYSSIMEFGALDGLADDVATAHDELVCAMYNADGDEEALVALNDKIDKLFTSAEALILTNMNMGATLKGLYAGRYDQQDVAENLETAGYDVGDFDCTCLEGDGEHIIQYTWPSSGNWQNWSHTGSDSIVADGIEIYCPQNIYSGGYTRLSMTQLGTDLGLTDLSNRHYLIRKITFNAKATAANAGNPSIGISYSGSAPAYWQFTNVLVWTEYDTSLIAVFDDPGYHITPTGFLQVFPYGGVGNYTRFDDVTIDFDSYIV